MNWMAHRRRFHRRRRILKLLVSLVTGLLLVALAGIGLPSERVTSGTITIDRPRESVWRVLTDLDGMPQWRSDLTRLERLPDRDGRPVWRETGPSGSRVVRLATLEPPRRLVMRQADADSGGAEGGNQREVDLTEADWNRTVVRVTEAEQVGPLRRVLSRLVPARAREPRLLRDLSQWLNGNRRQILNRAELPK